jgi:subtilisin family serine protease
LQRTATSLLLTLVGLVTLAPSALPRVGAAPEPRAAKEATGPEAAPGRLIAKFKAGAANNARGLLVARHGLREVAALRGIGAFVLEFADEARDPHAVAAALRDSELVEYAEPDYVLRAARLPSDPLFPELWGLHDGADHDIDAPQAWDVTTGDPAVVVGVIDTGIAYTHPDLAANMWRNLGEVPGNFLDDDRNGWVDDVYGVDCVNGDGDPLDDHDHGSHVAGTIGAVANNGRGVVGVAWDVRLMALKFLAADGSGLTSDAVECLDYARSMRLRGVNVRLTSNSWGGTGQSQALSDAIRRAADAGILFVAAAGNAATNSDTEPFYPAAHPHPEILSVAATSRSDALASFSNYGPRSVDLAAPGVGILSTVRSGSYGSFSGTSMATPHVAGAAALVFARNPGASPLGVKAAILNGVDPLPSLAGRLVSGGRLDARRALDLCEQHLPMLATDLRDGFSVRLGDSVDVHVELRDCAAPVLGASVTLSGAGTQIAARDDGVAPDAARDDAIYTATWTPTQGGATAVAIEAAFPGGAVARTVQGTVTFLSYRMESVPFAWVDASQGTPVAAVGDDVSALVPIGFGFDYFGATHTSVRVSSNGYLTFGSSGTSYVNSAIPSPNQPNDLIAPFWDDLVAGSGAIRTLLEGVAPGRRLVIQWNDVGFFGGTGAVTFQAILHEGSGRIVFQYLDVRTSDFHDRGGSASVGIEDAAGGLGIAHSVNQPLLADATAIAFASLACADGDADGVCDAEDVCLTKPDPGQLDSNADGYGNACDPDFDDDGVVGGSDYLLLVRGFGARSGDGDPAYDLDLDCNGDGALGAADMLVLGAAFGGPPGPSGLACAGTIPCPAP